MRRAPLAGLCLILVLPACDGGPSTTGEVVEGAGPFAEPPPPHPEMPVGPPRLETLVYEDGTQWACSVQPVSLQESPELFVTLNPAADVLFPGSLVQGATLDTGAPQPIPVRRGPGTVVLSLVNGAAGGEYQRALGEITQGNVTTAQNEILRSLGDGGSAIPAKFVYDYDLFDSDEKFAAALDVRASWLSLLDVRGGVSFDHSAHYTRAVIRLSQEFFTMSLQIPTTVDEFFHPSVTPDELARFAGPGNPPGYVSSVTYGRRFYLVFESTASSDDLRAAVDAIFRGGLFGAEGHLRAEYAATQARTRVQLYALGGASDGLLAAAVAAPNTEGEAGLFAALAAYLEAGGTFSPSNPGLPIAYTVRDVLNRRTVKVDLGTEYGVRRCLPVVDEGRMKLWLDAAQAEWSADQSMTAWSGLTETQNEPTRFGQVGPGELNGRGAVRFGDNDSHVAGLDCSFAIGGDYSVVAVARKDIPDAFPGQAALILTGGDGSGPAGSGLSIGWGPEPDQFWIDHRQVARWFHVAPQTDGHVLVADFSPTTGMTLHSNGLEAATTGTYQGAADTTPVSALDGCGLGGVPWGYFGGHSLRGTIGEIRAFDHKLIEAERRVVECELGAKWGIAVADCVEGKPIKTY